MENLNSLESLKQHTIIVGDTGDINSIKKLLPQDATTNPTLLVKSSEQKEYAHLVHNAIEYAAKTLYITDLKGNINNNEFITLVLDKLSVNFGKEILSIVPGYVSTEIDARLSFDTQASIERARKIIKLYEEEGISNERILIKVVSTWEGIEAAKVLEQEGIKTNLTLIFTLPQAVKCAEDGITLISPFVGRINDGYSKKYNKTYLPDEEPGILAVKEIYYYLKKFNYKTIIMAASLRSAESCLEISGIDRITMPPAVIESLMKINREAVVKLTHQIAEFKDIKRINVDEKNFRWLLNENEIGNEKLCEGIRLFSQDAIKLEKLIKKKILEEKI